MNELALVIKEILDGYKTDPDRDIFIPRFEFRPDNEGMIIGVRNANSGYNNIYIMDWKYFENVRSLKGFVSFHYEKSKQNLLSENFRVTGQFTPSQFEVLSSITNATKPVFGYAHIHVENVFIRVDWSTAKRMITTSYTIRTKGRKFHEFCEDLQRFIDMVASDPAYRECVHCQAKTGPNELECDDCYKKRVK